MKIDRTKLTIHNRTNADMRPFHEAIVSAGETGVLDDVIADIFTVRREERADGRTWLTVDWA